MLIELEAQDYPRVRPLFRASYPNLAFVHAVLERAIPGCVWAGSGEREFAVALVATEAPFCFAAGAVTPALLDEMRALLADRPPIKLVHPRGLASAAPQLGFVAAERAQFGPGPGGYAPRDLRAPPGFELAAVDGHLFSRLNWRDPVLAIFGSVANYLRHGFGVCLLHDDQLVAEIHGVVGGGLCEFGCHTRADYRRRGLSSLVLGAACKHAVALGLAPFTTFDAGKIESEALSRSAGLHYEFHYPISQRIC
ncbi:GNAT family N-acetyltransferase [Nannocystis bainbridge]|uniref:GNAT family N-acetyltransferase n=1 Tax=Nannocystis bainbridge TaxID=2995303 RepID=A0ABT5ECW2_9BACT|nr:GNAT family N-acetyltransferase [Nannocystis bainbridge]MDC0723712.1 GNAT family N-acetyltransferase [Nannocystis bainbridge]